MIIYCILDSSLLEALFFFFNVYLFGCARSSLWHEGSSLWHAGSFSCGRWALSCSMQGSSSPTRDNPGPLHWERSLNRWTTREAPGGSFKVGD